MDKKKQGFVVMAKPVGALCNLRCKYCYYLGAPVRRDEKAQEVMSEEVLERLVIDCISGNPGPNLQFNWHGGEPLLAGIPFYEKALALQKKYCPEGWHLWNNIQTNGVLLTDEWADFLVKNRFDVGVSIDGTALIHDKFRPHPDGSGSYEETAAAIERLMNRGLKPDLLCTVTKDSCRTPDKVYRALKAFHTGWIQFIPIVVRTETGLTEESVTPELYGRFLCDVFDEWVCHDLGNTDVQLFAETALVLSGGEASLCTMAPVCGRVPVLEHDGNVYACDHFVDRAHCIGNILENPLEEMLEKEAQRRFGAGKRENLPEACLTCPYLKLCNGGCLKDRFTDDGRYYLCEGLKAFFAHAEAPLHKMMALSRKGTPNGTIMAMMRSEMKKGKR